MHQEEHELAFCSLLVPQSSPQQLPNKTRAHHNTKKLLSSVGY